MKKIALSVAFMMLLQLAFAGGILTNYNQSAQYVRMLSRNASLNVDAVFYNPAGLIKLEDGWHFSFSSQTLWQTRNITSGFPLLNNHDYEGKTFAPVFPDLFAVYKKDKFALSFAVAPVGGGGSAKFDNGLPTFEIPVSKIVPALSGLSQISPALAVSGYNMNMSLDASSIFWGIQVGASYAFNDIISGYLGVRVLPSTNTYNGTISDIALTVAGQSYPAATWLTGAASTVSGVAAQATAGATAAAGAATSMQPIIDGGGSAYTLAQLEGAQMITAAQRAQLEGGLLALGVTQAQIDAMNAGQVQGTYSTASTTLTQTAATLTGTAATLSGTAGQMGDKNVDVKQKGMGFTPIISVNISPNEDWNIALKYEHKTKLTLTNETTVDDMGMFPDGGKSSSDIPGIFTAGVGYRGLDWLELQLSYNLYLDKGVDWGNNVRYTSVGETLHREIDKNSYELGLGLQFNVSDNFAVSVGGLYSTSGVANSYQSDFSYSNSSKTIAGGFMWKISDRVTFDAGVLNTFYDASEVTFTDPDVGNYKDTYNKTTFGVAAGLTFSIF